MPSGAIAAFAGACPAGWSEYTAARGRFLVGAGSADGQTYSVGQTGGEAFHALTKAEMPSHAHEAGGTTETSVFHNPYGYTPQRWDFLGSVYGYVGHAFLSKPAGGDQPHENRPPYAAVTWCQKV